MHWRWNGQRRRPWAARCAAARTPPTALPPLAGCAEIPVAHAILAEEREVTHEQPPDPTQTMPFPDALLQVGWVVQVSAGRWVGGCVGLEGAWQVLLLVTLDCLNSPKPGPHCMQAARDPAIQIPPEKVPLLYGLACSIHFLLPAAYYYAAKWCEREGAAA